MANDRILIPRVRELKQRILALADISEGFINNGATGAGSSSIGTPSYSTSSNFINLINDIQIEITRELYNVYRHNGPWVEQTIEVSAGTGEFNWGYQSALEQSWNTGRITSKSQINSDGENSSSNQHLDSSGYFELNQSGGGINVTSYPEYFWLNPMYIIRVDRVDSNNVRRPMGRFNSASLVQDLTQKSWDQYQVRFEYTPARMRFDPINLNQESVVIRYIQKPYPLNDDDDKLDPWIAEHIQLAAIEGVIQLRTKEEGSIQELIKMKADYLDRLHRQCARDFGQPLHIVDVQPDLDRHDDLYNIESLMWRY